MASSHIQNFFSAILQDDLSKAEEIWAAGHLPESVPEYIPEESDSNRPILLHVVANLGETECIKALLSNMRRKDTVNHKDPLGWTPLMYAIANGHTGIVSVLLDGTDCDVNVKDAYLQTALHIEAQYQSKSCYTTGALLDKGADIDAEDIMGLTPFLRAVEANNCVACEVLFCKKCNTSICGYDGRNALHIAALHHHGTLVEWLLSVGFHVHANSLDHNLNTPLMLCVQSKMSPRNMYSIMKRLLRYNQTINQQDYHGNTALLLAIGNPSVIKWNHVELLLDAGSDPNIPNREGLTPIWQAVYDGIHYPDRQRVIQLLVRSNCYLDMSCRGKLLFTSGLNSVYCYETFMSPLEVALNSGYYDAAKMLLTAGCQIHKDLRYDTKVADVPEELAWFQNFLENPQSLQHLCRLVIRKVLDKNIHDKVSQLPLPFKVKDFLLLQGFC